MGAGEIGLPSLRWMLDLTAHEVVGVYTQPDKKIGRKQVLPPPAVQVLAEEAGNELRSYTDNLDRDPEQFEYLDSFA